MKLEAPSNVSQAYPVLGFMTRYSETEDSGIVGTDLKAQRPKQLGPTKRIVGTDLKVKKHKA